MTNEDEFRDYLELVAANLRRTRRCLRGVEEKYAGPVAIVGMGIQGLWPALTTWRPGDAGGLAPGDWRYRVTWMSAAYAGIGALSGTWLLVAPERKQFRDVVARCAGAMASRGARADTLLVDCGTASRDVLAGLVDGALAGEPLAGVVSFLGLSETPGMLVLIQALGDAGISAPLWLLAREALAVGVEQPTRGDGVGGLPGDFGVRAAALLCTVLADCDTGQAVMRPAGIEQGPRRRAVRSAQAHRECFQAVDEGARTPAQR